MPRASPQPLGNLVPAQRTVGDSRGHCVGLFAGELIEVSVLRVEHGVEDLLIGDTLALEPGDPLGAIHPGDEGFGPVVQELVVLFGADGVLGVGGAHGAQSSFSSSAVPAALSSSKPTMSPSSKYETIASGS